MFNWLSLAHSEAPGEPSIRRIIFSVTFISVIALCFCGLKWPIPDNVRTISIALITAAAGAVGAGRFAEAFDRRDK